MQKFYGDLYKEKLNKLNFCFNFLKLGFLKKLSFQKVHNEKVFFQKTECLVKVVKKCFLKKLSIWLVFIKVVKKCFLKKLCVWLTLIKVVV